MAALITVIVYSVLIAYVLGSALYFYGARSGKDKVLHSARMVTIVGFILNLLALITRTIIAGRLPLANSIEFMLWFAMITVVLYLIYERKIGMKEAGGAVMLIAALHAVVFFSSLQRI